MTVLVREVMSGDPVTIHTEATIRAALRLLAGHGVTSLPVVDHSGRIVGVVGEADLIRGHVRPDPALGAAPGDEATPRTPYAAPERIEQVMTHQTVVVHPETDLIEVARIVAATGIKSLPVVDASDQVVGVVSRSDVVRLLALSDDELQQEITDRLIRAGMCGWAVQVRNGVVELTAAAAPDGEDRAARGIAESMPGVGTVRVTG